MLLSFTDAGNAAVGYCIAVYLFMNLATTAAGRESCRVQAVKSVAFSPDGRYVIGERDIENILKKSG